MIGAIVVALAALGTGGAWAAGILPWQNATVYRTATVGYADLTQMLTLTGTVTRANQANASFGVSGTVTKVSVQVGQKVTKGHTLATLDSAPLKAALLDARASLAQAQAQYHSDQTAAVAATSASTSARSSAKSGSSAKAKAALTAAVAAMNKALAAEQVACKPSTAPTTTAVHPSPAPAASTSDSSASATSSSSAVAPVAPPKVTIPSNLSETVQQACGAALTTLAQAEQATSNDIQAMLKLTQGTGGSSSAGSGSSNSGSTGKSSTASKGSLAQDVAAITIAQQAVDLATGNLSSATLRAPIAGTVGNISLSVGSPDSGSSVTIVGGGAATVSVQVPLGSRPSLSVGQKAQILPAGSVTTLTATVKSISPLPTSTTSTTPSYAVVVRSPESTPALTTGAAATVSIQVANVAHALSVPISAVTPTGQGQGTVQVMGSGTPATLTVGLGPNGGGFVQITSGLTAGQTVVLADPSQPLPSNTSQGLGRATGGGGGGGGLAPPAQGGS